MRRPDLSDRGLELRPLLLLLALGIVVGVLWRLLTPWAVDRSDAQEVLIARDGTLAVLNLVAGALVGMGSVMFPGRAPAVRCAILVVGSVLGALLAWLVGWTLGLTGLGAKGIVLLWPVLAAIMMFAGAVLPGARRNARGQDQPYPGRAYE